MEYIWQADPVALSLLGLEIRWYGLVYISGMLLTWHWGYALYQKANPRHQMLKSQWENLIFGGFIFGIVGGRLGHFLFYDPQLLITNPMEILQLWHGGMSIHGGLLLASVWIYGWARHYQISWLKLSDILVWPLAIILIAGRYTNWLNGELVGIPTQQSWGVVFPHVDNLLRHPTQLYEAGTTLILAMFLTWSWCKKYYQHTGLLTAIFLIGYGSLRWIVELWKTDHSNILWPNTGQILCVIMITIGFYLVSKKKLWQHCSR